MKLFNLDSPIMQGLSRVADIMWLNVLTVLCCLPIVTVGASLTAMNYVALKMARNEDCYITKSFFKSFKQNFRQSTIIWMIMLIVAVVLAFDVYTMREATDSISKVVSVLVFVAAILWICIFLFVFPVLAKFDNTVWRTLKNAFVISIMQFPKTVLMALMYGASIYLFFCVLQILPIVLMFGVAVPAWVSAKLYNKFFKKLEDKVLEANPIEAPEEPAEDERIFRDELDESLMDKRER